MPKAAAAAYYISELVDVETASPQGGTITMTFQKGSHSPKNEGEEAALDAAVASGYGTFPETTPPAQEES